MRVAITSLCIFICVVLTIGIVFTVNNYHTRKEEVESSLSQAISAAGKKIQLKDNNNPREIKKCISKFVQYLILETNSDSDIDVEILTCDVKRGILDVEVTEKYKWFGMNKKVSIRRTVVLEQL